MKKLLNKFFSQCKLSAWIFLMLVGKMLPGYAQSELAATTQGASFQLPQLPEGGGDAVIIRAIQLRVKYPKQALRDEAQGQAVVSFAVAPSGQVCLIKLEKGIRPDLDTAVAQAVRRLPHLLPAMQHGKPVACLLRAPVAFFIDNPSRLPRKPLPAADSTLLYTVVTRMPIYQGRPGYQQLATDLVAEYLQNSGNAPHSLPKYGASVVLTVNAEGKISQLEQLRSDEAQLAALEATFGDQVAKMESDEEDEKLSEVCLAQLAEIARRLPRLTPAYAAGQPVATQLVLKLARPE